MGLASSVSYRESPSIDLEDATLFFLREPIATEHGYMGKNGIFSSSSQCQSQELENMQRCSLASVTLGLKTTKL